MRRRSATARVLGSALPSGALAACSSASAPSGAATSANLQDGPAVPSPGGPATAASPAPGQPGVYDIACALHPQMTGQIQVVEVAPPAPTAGGSAY